jgi:hypothetical protein
MDYGTYFLRTKFSKITMKYPLVTHFGKMCNLDFWKNLF